MQPPSNLVKLPEDKVLLLSDIIDNTKNNYAIAYETRVKLESLQQWLTEQLALYNKGLK